MVHETTVKTSILKVSFCTKEKKKKILELWLETLYMRYAFIEILMLILSSKAHFTMSAFDLMLTYFALFLEYKNLLSPFEFSLKMISSYQKKELRSRYI